MMRGGTTLKGTDVMPDSPTHHPRRSDASRYMLIVTREGHSLRRPSASSISLPTVKRLEAKPCMMAAHMSTVTALRTALEKAGVEFIDENGGGAGVRLRKRNVKQSK
jgi:hypothetical protein